MDAIILPVVKLKLTGQQNRVYDAETQLSGNLVQPLFKEESGDAWAPTQSGAVSANRRGTLLFQQK